MKINGYIFYCEIVADGVEGHPGCLSWHSEFVEGGLRMYIKNINAFFSQFRCGKCRHCFDKPCHLNDHVKICNGGEVKHIWTGGVYEPKQSIKQSLTECGIDVPKHDFIFPHLVVFHTESSLLIAIFQPEAKHVKMCSDISGQTVTRTLKFASSQAIRLR